MGKIKKIKEERKKNEVESQIKKAKNRRLYLKLSFILVLLFTITGVGSFGYQKYDEQILKGITKIKETLRISQGESSTKEKNMEPKTYSQVPEMKIDVAKKYTAKFETSMGDFEIELFADKAPKTVNNFVFLSREGFYDGLIFHRVIQDFMVQGGDPKGDGTGGPGYKFEDEINNVKLERGILAMANSGPNTNGSQFFIVTKESAEWLDGKHTAFGKVTSGLDLVMKIEKAETGENDRPIEAIIIKNIKISEVN